MASKSFNLTDSPDGGSGPCAKLCIFTCILAFIGIMVVVGIYVYQSTYGAACSSPELDESGLSNWTYRADQVVYACFPGFFLESGSHLMPAKCENGMWNPPPPACNSLPLRIDCQINNQSLTGNITMWQEDAKTPTFISGFVNYTDAIKPQAHLMEFINVSKRACNVSHTNIPTNDTDLYPETKEKNKILKIQFNSTELKAYKKAEIYVNMIFIDRNTTATLVSVHQANLTMVMTGSDPSLNSSWNWVKEKRSHSRRHNESPLQIEVVSKHAKVTRKSM